MGRGGIFWINASGKASPAQVKSNKEALVGLYQKTNDNKKAMDLLKANVAEYGYTKPADVTGALVTRELAEIVRRSARIEAA